MKSNKGQGLTSIIVFGFVVVVLLLAVFISLLSATTTVQTFTQTELTSKTDTVLYVLLNNNEFSPGTALPLKDILAIAIGQGKTLVGSEITIEYDGVTEKVTIRNIIEKNMEKMGITDYEFYVMRGPAKIMYLSTLGFNKNTTTETEDISIPYHDPKVATVVLKTSVVEYGDKVITCPDDIDVRCYPRLTCENYMGKCMDDKYACSILECCCGNPVI